VSACGETADWQAPADELVAELAMRTWDLVRATGVLLIEQFATVALGLAHHAHIMEGGRIRFSGLASELREHPDLLRSAYLLRGSNAKPGLAP
jgi:ABC-type branched-subunit amino acid transport system ATPase component